MLNATKIGDMNKGDNTSKPIFISDDDRILYSNPDNNVVFSDFNPNLNVVSARLPSGFFCADCFSQDYKTKTDAQFIAHGFAVCEPCFKRYCERQKIVYQESWKQANGK